MYTPYVCFKPLVISPGYFRRRLTPGLADRRSEGLKALLLRPGRRHLTPGGLRVYPFHTTVSRPCTGKHPISLRSLHSVKQPRGAGQACESDGGDSDGQGAPQGGKAPPVSAHAAEFFAGFKLGLRGLEASFMRK